MFRRSIYSLGRLTQKQLSFGVQEFRDLYSAESVRSTEFRHVSTKSAKRTELKNVPATESNLEVDRFSQILEEISRQERFSHFKSSPSVLERLEDLYRIFPKYSESLCRILLLSPEILNYSAEAIDQISRVFLQHGDDTIMSREESLLFIGECPELVGLGVEQVEEKLTDLLVKLSAYHLPWNIILLENPQLLFTDVTLIHEYLENLRQYFKHKELFNLLANNPKLFDESFDSVEKKIKYLLGTMNVSLHRISKTPDSLQSSLDFYHTRYEFLLRSGLYRHPDANQQGMKLVEAEPELTKIILKSDLEFLENCSPNITLEEFNAFKSILYIDQEERSKDLTETDVLTDVEFIRKEDDRFSGTYKGKKRSLKK